MPFSPFLIYVFYLMQFILDPFKLIFAMCLKFMFSKKAKKIDEIFTVDLTVTTYCQITVKILSIFVAFSENMNFT